MTAPAAARENKYGDRVYPVPKPGTLEMVELPGVTGLLEAIAKPGLEKWKRWRLAQALSLRPDWVVLAGSGDYDAKGTRSGAKDVVKQFESSDNTSSNTGTGIHYWTEAVDDDTILWEMVPEPIKPAVAAYAQKKADFGWELVRKEFTCYSHTYGYAGTADRQLRFPTLDSKVHTGDVKTGNAVYADYGLQMACYTFADGIWIPPKETPKADAAFAQLAKDIKEGVNIPPTATGKKRSSWNQAAKKAAEAALYEEYWDEYAENGTHLPMPEDLCEDVAYILHVSATDCELVPLYITGLRPAVAGITALHAFINNKVIVGDPISPNRTPTSAPPQAPDQAPSGDESVGESGLTSQDPVEDTQDSVVGMVSGESPEQLPFVDRCETPTTDTLEPATEIPVAEPAPRAKRVEVFRDRIAALPKEAKQKLAFNWPPGMPTFKQSSDQSEEQLEQLDRILWEIEAEFTTTELLETATRVLEDAFPGSITTN